MAHKLMLPSSHMGLGFIYNVTKHVGPRKVNPNDADDVQLVQFLIAETFKVRPPEITVTGLGFPTPTGRFDTTTGFWLFSAQVLYTNKGATIDGVASPARGEKYRPDCPWVIAHLNFWLHQLAPDVYNRLPDNQNLRPSLRASLK